MILVACLNDLKQSETALKKPEGSEGALDLVVFPNWTTPEIACYLVCRNPSLLEHFKDHFFELEPTYDTMSSFGPSWLKLKTSKENIVKWLERMEGILFVT